MLFKINSNTPNYIKKKKYLPVPTRAINNTLSPIMENNKNNENDETIDNFVPISDKDEDEEIKLDELGMNNKPFEPRNSICDRMNKENKDSNDKKIDQIY